MHKDFKEFKDDPVFKINATLIVKAVWTGVYWRLSPQGINFWQRFYTLHMTNNLKWTNS